MDTDRLTVSEVARYLRCSASTILKKERRGEIPRAERTRGGWRVYRSGDVERIAATFRRPMSGAYTGTA